MPTLDWIFLSVLAASMLLGAWRGLVSEILSLLGWIAAFMLAQWYAPQAAAWLPVAGAAAPLQYAAGFVVVFVATVFTAGIVAFGARGLISAVGLRPSDRLLGAGFGLMRGVLLLVAVTVVVSITPLKNSKDWQASQGVLVAKLILNGLKPILPPQFGSYLSS